MIKVGVSEKCEMNSVGKNNNDPESPMGTVGDDATRGNP